MRRFKFSHFVLIALTSFLLAFLSGCGGGDSSKSGPPTPTSPRDIQSSGTPLLFFGAGAGRRTPGADDAEYQEYLLWKEWQQYLKYKQWLRDQANSPSEASESQ
jgi:hypothetical protein